MLSFKSSLYSIYITMLHNLAEKNVASAQISWLRKFKYRSKRKIGTEVNMYMRLGKGPVSCVHRREAALKLDLEVKLLWKISNKAHLDYRKQPTLSRLTAIMQNITLIHKPGFKGSQTTQTSSSPVYKDHTPLLLPPPHEWRFCSQTVLPHNLLKTNCSWKETNSKTLL